MITLVPPRFWYEQNPSLPRLLLTPLSWLWLAGACVRRAMATPYEAKMPVICVGNVMIGGTGKTPTAIALLSAFGASRPCFLTRGYRGRTSRAVLVTQANAHDHGDEAVLLSRHAPVIVAKDRVAGLKLAEKQGFDLVIADDGFQNPHFIKNASVLVFDGGVGIGNGECIPAGPMREPLNFARKRANAVLIVGDDKTYLRTRLEGTPVFTTHITTQARSQGAYVAFAGIGRPQKFFDTLAAAGYNVVEAVPFPDHHAYDSADIKRLRNLAQRYNAKLITTEKDSARLPDLTDIESLPVQLVIDDLPGLLATLRRA